MSELYDPERDGTGTYCCPICLYWHETPEEKDACLEKHGYEIIEIAP